MIMIMIMMCASLEGSEMGLLRICVCVWVCGLVVCIGREVVAFYLRHELEFQGGFSKLVSWVVLGKVGFQGRFRGCFLVVLREVWFLLLVAEGWLASSSSSSSSSLSCRRGGEGRIWSERLAGELS
jgi:hypothetical protein